MKTAIQKAREKHEKKRKIKTASFNTETEKELLEFANSVDFSSWVKEQIKESISHKKKMIQQQNNDC